MFHKMTLVLAALLASSAYALAQAPILPFPPLLPNLMQGTPEEQAACNPDAQRYCREFIPDSLRVLSCFQANRPKLSVACRRVLESHGQ
jgi:hypothetical protein